MEDSLQNKRNADDMPSMDNMLTIREEVLLVLKYFEKGVVGLFGRLCSFLLVVDVVDVVIVVDGGGLRWLLFCGCRCCCRFCCCSDSDDMNIVVLVLLK